MFTARVHGHRSTLTVNTARRDGPWTRVSFCRHGPCSPVARIDHPCRRAVTDIDVKIFFYSQNAWDSKCYQNDTRVHGPCWRPVSTAREHGVQYSVYRAYKDRHFCLRYYAQSTPVDQRLSQFHALSYTSLADCLTARLLTRDDVSTAFTVPLLPLPT